MIPRSGPVAAEVHSWRLTKDPRDLERVKRFIDLHSPYCHAACREAAGMTAWELGENLLKYGIEDEDGAYGTLSVEIAAGVTRVQTLNLAESEHTACTAMETVARLSSVPRAAELYRARVVDLFAKPVELRARLGLLRIAFEGGFRLLAFRDGAYLEMDAERRCDVKAKA